MDRRLRSKPRKKDDSSNFGSVETIWMKDEKGEIEYEKGEIE
jgi:hypothetical protein